MIWLWLCSYFLPMVIYPCRMEFISQSRKQEGGRLHCNPVLPIWFQMAVFMENQRSRKVVQRGRIIAVELKDLCFFHRVEGSHLTEQLIRLPLMIVQLRNVNGEPFAQGLCSSKVVFHLFLQILCQVGSVFVSQVVVRISFGRKVIMKDLEMWRYDTL